MTKVSHKDMGLSPMRFLEEETLMAITNNKELGDCLIAHEKKSKEDVEYTDYTLYLVGSVGEWVGEYHINFLFSRDLVELIKAFGEDSKEWEGKRVTLSGRTEGKFTRWIIKPAILEKEVPPVATEEKIGQ